MGSSSPPVSLATAEATKSMAQDVATQDLSELARLCPILRRFPIHRMNLRYDAGADVLYVKFADSAAIHQSELSEDDFLIEYDADRNIVGVTILDASSR
jgi:uncharacterized protein YuzE